MTVLEAIVESRDLGERWTGRVGGADPMSREQALRRWPRLVAHMICESLGYFTVESAASALAHYKAIKPYACEWYSHQCRCRGKGLFDEHELLQVGRAVVLAAIRRRKGHSGYMADYQQAIALVKAELAHRGYTSDMLASWF